MTPTNISQSTEHALEVRDAFREFIDDKLFPCVAAKAALTRDQMHIFVAGHLACPKDDQDILDFIYKFVDTYRAADNDFHTVCVIFPDTHRVDEKTFDRLLWERLQALSDLDAQKYPYDSRVDSNPSSPNFSFSLKEEAFFIIGLSPASSRDSRKFRYPAIVFNPHEQFEELRSLNRYDKMKNIVRKRDVALSGSINPMLCDFGDDSEVYQYSGMRYDKKWECPYKYKN
ncbi:guanitoxin biosynthesis heme-dependent pre-guanitoxin N-hydroxylase GntA [Chryseobacterium takakiae]|uniref:YqcI/YcgG family protein n=1 Tax=Chryseobacterium takakiae TaxID=1302685 RepID=A0A1M4W9M6_9FLAO|nr:guanitoxin biosynthesis heme-dependent pre-guanitoxin N-hydroxylase GntA [Chryseobacterium takakiae]SHE77860.1 hypothetical protein SAMN05444408_10472 [Chryseobacterium takakiae]